MSAIGDRISPVQKESLQEAIYQRMRELLLEGGIAPGQSMTVASLAEAFNVSPMPVREALTRLTSVGALTVVSGRTIGVPKLTLDRLDDLRNVRVEVETAAAKWATARRDKQLIDRLDEIRLRLLQTGKEKQIISYIGANYDYHFAIYRYCGSHVLISIIENLWLQVSPYFHLLRETGNLGMSTQHHDAMYQGIVDGDAAMVCKALTADIDGAYRLIRQMI